MEIKMGIDSLSLICHQVRTKKSTLCLSTRGGVCLHHYYIVLPHIISQAAAVTLRGIHPLKDPNFTAQSFPSILCRKRFTPDPVPAPRKCHFTAGQSPEPDGSLNPSLCLLLGCEFYSSLGCRRSVLLRSYQLSNFESHASIRKVWMENTFLREILPSRSPLHKIATLRESNAHKEKLVCFPFTHLEIPNSCDEAGSLIHLKFRRFNINFAIKFK